MLPDPKKLVAKIAAAERELRNHDLISPCVPGGLIRAKVDGLVRSYLPKPNDFEGWGAFHCVAKVAERTREPEAHEMAAYFERMPQLRMVLAHQLQGKAWLAYPLNESDMEQRPALGGIAKPMPVHLVEKGSQFDRIVTRIDGGVLWFECVDRQGDPQESEELRAAMRAGTVPDKLVRTGLTPELRTAYSLAVQQSVDFEKRQIELARKREDDRIRAALTHGGGTFREKHDRGSHWLVEWTTRDGQHHSSAIEKKDLTVMSAGICLSGKDKDFDLQSLVGVVDRKNHRDHIRMDYDDYDDD